MPENIQNSTLMKDVEKLLKSDNLFSEIAINHFQHSRNTEWYENFSKNIEKEINQKHNASNSDLSLGEFGKIWFPFTNFGTINSSHLFGLDELIIFSWYFVNKSRYRRVLDLGANVGLHSLLMGKLGFAVDAYEPDETHLDTFKKVLENNKISGVQIHEKAVSDFSGSSKYTRVLGNTTGSHLTGSKENTYGDLDEVTVKVENFAELATNKYNFIKMDVEGHEAVLLKALESNLISESDIMLEVGTKKNAELIFNEISRLKLNAFSQKINWEKVETLESLPVGHKEGSLFLTTQETMNWNS